MYESGLMIGHFEPLHLGQMRSILDAAGQAKNLHLVIMTHPSPHPDFKITLQDKARWLQMACADLPFIHIHTTDEIELPVHESFADVTIDITASNAKLQHLIDALNLPAETVVFVAENHPLAQSDICKQLIMQVVTTPLQPDFDSYAIARNPVAYCQRYIRKHAVTILRRLLLSAAKAQVRRPWCISWPIIMVLALRLRWDGFMSVQIWAAPKLDYNIAIMDLLPCTMRKRFVMQQA